jgi:hypothetical protein
LNKERRHPGSEKTNQHGPRLRNERVRRFRICENSFGRELPVQRPHHAYVWPNALTRIHGVKTRKDGNEGQRRASSAKAEMTHMRGRPDVDAAEGAGHFQLPK